MLTLKPEQVLFSQGEPITGLFLIISGSFSLTFPGGEYTLSGGDVLGICELSGSTHFMTAQALENTSLLPCAVTDFASLKSFLAENTDYCSIFSRSAFRQIGCLFRYYEATEEKSNLLSAHPDVAAALVGNVCKDTLSLLSSLKRWTRSCCFCRRIFLCREKPKKRKPQPPWLYRSPCSSLRTPPRLCRS